MKRYTLLLALILTNCSLNANKKDDADTQCIPATQLSYVHRSASDAWTPDCSLTTGYTHVWLTGNEIPYSSSVPDGACVAAEVPQNSTCSLNTTRDELCCIPDTCPEAHYDVNAPACSCGTQYMNKSGYHNVPDNCHIMECDGASSEGGRLQDLKKGETCILTLCCDYPK